MNKNWKAITRTRTILVPFPSFRELEMEAWVNQGIQDSDGIEETIIGWHWTEDGYLVALGQVLGWQL